MKTTIWKYEDHIKTKGDFIYAVWAALDEVARNGATHQWLANQCAELCRIAEKKGWLK